MLMLKYHAHAYISCSCLNNMHQGLHKLRGASAMLVQVRDCWGGSVLKVFVESGGQLKPILIFEV